MAKPDISPSVARFGSPSSYLLPVLRGLRVERGSGIALSSYTADVLAGRKPLCRGLDYVLMEAALDPRVPDMRWFLVSARLRYWQRLVRGLSLPPFPTLHDLETVAQGAHDVVQGLTQRPSATVGDHYAALDALAWQAEATDLLGLGYVREIARLEGRSSWTPTRWVA